MIWASEHHSKDETSRGFLGVNDSQGGTRRCASFFHGEVAKNSRTAATREEEGIEDEGEGAFRRSLRASHGSETLA